MGLDDLNGKPVFLVAHDNAYVTAESEMWHHLWHNRYISTKEYNHLEPNMWECFELRKYKDKWTLRLTNPGFTYWSAEPSGVVVANSDSANDWEMWDIDVVENRDDRGYVVTLKSHHGKYLCAEAGGAIVANRNTAGTWERFTLYEFHFQAPGFRS
ncbi:MAG TPA: hypothetical protein VK191_02870 [Symbiobacteriaceae bacterium]|nr:hypothetical protein [Symbiobacteriaceae bacterium]